MTQEDLKNLIFEGLDAAATGMALFSEKTELVYTNPKILTFFPSQEAILTELKGELKNFTGSSKSQLTFEKKLASGEIFEFSLNKFKTKALDNLFTIVFVNNITEFKKADLLKNDFISLITHELKTPLTAITGPATLILSQAAGEINESQKKFLTVIRKNAERLARLLNNLSDLARIESGKIAIKKERSNITEIIDSSLNQVSLLLKEKDLQVKKEIAENLPDVFVDGLKLEQALINLLTNAIKFSLNSSKITVSAEAKNTASGQMVIVSVADQGCGIASENLEKIFEKFFREPSSKKIEGTGLGLTIARYIVQAHGGQIWAESQVAQGSKFSFSLPV